MPPRQLSGLLPCLSREKRPPPVSTSVKAFRHFIDGSLALASPDHTCRNLVPAFLQRSPRPLLTTAACSGLRPAPDCRPRGAPSVAAKLDSRHTLPSPCTRLRLS